MISLLALAVQERNEWAPMDDDGDSSTKVEEEPVGERSSPQL